MKTSKRILAYLLTVAMIVSLASAMTLTSFAAGAPTELVYTPTGGSAATYTIPEAATVASADAAAAKLADLKDKVTIVVEVLEADIKTIDGSDTKFEEVIIPDNSDTLTFFKETAELDAETVGTTIATATTDIKNLNIGDVIWMKSVDAGDSTVVRIVLATSSSGGIEGEGQKTVVAYNVVVPLSLNFALDPLEVADKSAIAGADYKIINKTTEAVKVEFTLNTDGATKAAMVASADEITTAQADKKAYMEVVNAQSVAVTTGTVGEVSYDAEGETDAAKKLNAGRRTKAFPAKAAEQAGDSIKTAFALEKYDGTEVTAGNVSAFTFRGALNPNHKYEAKDIVVKGTYTLNGMGTKKYTDEVKPVLQGAGAYAQEIPGYGFKSGTGMGADLQNTPYFYKDYAYAGHVTFTYTDAEATAETAKMLFDFNGAEVEDIAFGEVDGSGGFSSQTALFTMDYENGEIELDKSWAAAATNRTFEWYLVLDNGDVWAITVNANAA